jgi:hypothetical protein
VEAVVTYAIVFDLVPPLITPPANRLLVLLLQAELPPDVFNKSPKSEEFPTEAMVT